jgi:beta-lactam-binding protein with PASTA domain
MTGRHKENSVSSNYPDRRNALRVRLARRSRVGAVALVAILFGGVLIAAVGVGHTVARAVLSDGSEYLERGHKVARVNGETGLHDAETARTLATGREWLENVRMPDGRIAVVNRDTGHVMFLDPPTMEPTGPAVTGSRGQVEILPTGRHGYLIDRGRNVVEEVTVDGRPGGSIAVPEGVKDAVPVGESLWLITRGGEVVQIADGQRKAPIRLGGALRITVADGHPVVVTPNGQAYTIDGASPTQIGEGLPSGERAVLGSWRGADRYVVAVDRTTGRTVALDPRTHDRIEVEVPVSAGSDLGAPVVLEKRIYVPDYSGPRLWQVDLSNRTAKEIKVPGQRGSFDVKVSSGRVWANQQYDQRALIVDSTGAWKDVDKGAGDATSDSERKDHPKSDSVPPKPGSKEETPPTGSPRETTTSAPPEAKKVVVPRSLRGVPYRAACETLQGMGLRCEPVAAGDVDGVDAGEVISTQPAGGSSVPAGSRIQVRYVGPRTTPNLIGLVKDTACKQVQDLQLRCEQRPSGDLAATPERLGVVVDQNPRPSSDIEKNGQVTITFPEAITLPSFVGQIRGTACEQITSLYKMTCEQGQGTPTAGQCTTAGTVYGQEPAEGQVARIGAAIRVKVCAGKVPVDDYVNPKPQTVAQACAKVERQGFRCNRTVGVTAVGTGFEPGVVYDQDPKPGAQADLGQSITVTSYSGQGKPVPDVTGQDFSTACSAIVSAGYICAQNERLGPRAKNVVNEQDGAGTVRPINSPVNVYYSPWQRVDYYIYRHDTLDVWVLRQEGQRPPGYGGPAFRVGGAYPPGEKISHPSAVNGFSCTSGGGKCNGLDTNHFYSHMGTAYPGFVGPTSVANFMTCDVQGTKPIYRLWRDRGDKRFYGIGDSTAGWEGNEKLECVWP